MVLLLLLEKNDDGQCNLPPLDEGTSYTQVSAGAFHTALLRSDGDAVACGSNSFGQCEIPPLAEGMSYMRISAGYHYTVLLQNDGLAKSCGSNECGQCDILPLDRGMFYTEVFAGLDHTVLLQSDGHAVAFGANRCGECKIPSPRQGHCYVPNHTPLDKSLVLQLDCVSKGDAVKFRCSDLAGKEKLRLKAHRSDLALNLLKYIACKLSVNLQSLQLIGPDGQLLAALCHANPKAKIQEVTGSITTAAG